MQNGSDLNAAGAHGSPQVAVKQTLKFRWFKSYASLQTNRMVSSVAFRNSPQDPASIAMSFVLLKRFELGKLAVATLLDNP